MVTVRAPASTANLGAGFDVFGLALDGRSDTLQITESGDQNITISSDGGVPTDVMKNTAGVTAAAIKDEFGTGGSILQYARECRPVMAWGAAPPLRRRPP